ncbi:MULTISPECIES: hypothetical protein [unclassified Mycobacterium]|uniref:hypothetical protein n=1 Tax=unclassified Mycobacterium TaxID=2642494 RepID=UPI0029C89848|nr:MULTISPECIES: hypothetical protein [unclassified Mycobacterium]
MGAINNHPQPRGPDMCAEVSHRRVLLQSRAVKLIGLLSAVAVAACAHTTELSKADPAIPVPTPGSPAVTFDDLQRAPVPALCEHDPGQLRNMQLPPQEGHRGNVGIALNYGTGAYKVAFGDLTGGGGDAAMVIHCNAGGVGWPETVELYTPGAKLDVAGPTRLGGVDLGDLTHGGREIVTDLSISDGVAHVTWMANGPNDGMCCPTVKMMADLRWDGSTVVVQNMHRAN